MITSTRARFELFSSPSLLTALLLGAAEGSAIPQSDTNSEPTRLPTVVVTAQKQAAEVESLPASVTAVTSETIEQADIHSVRDAAPYSPNLFLNEFTARKLSNPYFRGIGSSPNNPGVTTYIDGVPQLNANSSSIELIDVQQIEFLRGPQGALFGRNTIGGLINIQSRRPTETWQSWAQAEYGNYDFRDLRLTLSGPVIAHDLGASLGLGYSARDGYTKNDITGNRIDDREAFFGKGQLLWTPMEQWELRLIMSGERARDGDYALGDLNAVRARPHHVSHDFEGYTHRDILAPTLLASRAGEKIDFANITGFVWWKTDDLTDLDYSALPAATRRNEESEKQFTEELRFSSAKDAGIPLAEDIELSWQGGLFFFTQDYEQHAVNEVQPPFSQMPTSLQTRSAAELRDGGLGIYGQGTVTFWEKLDATAGLRVDYENKDAELATSLEPPVAPATASNPTKDFTQVSPQFALAYRLSPRQTFYASVSRGYKAGGFNPVSPAGRQAYDEESTWSYELGAKTLWWEERLSVRLALFYLNWQNLQLNLPTGAPGQFYIANAGDADSKGIELELHARPITGLDVFGSAAYTDARFLSGAKAGRTDPMGLDSIVAVGGNHLIYTPDYTLNGGVQYDWPVCRFATLYARAEAVVYGQFYYNPANTARQPAYTLANFRAGVRGNHWFAEGWIRNAFDAHYVPIAFEYPNGAFGGSGMVGESGAPLTFGLRAGLVF